YEKHLLVNGYADSIVEAINKYEGDPEYFTKYKKTYNNGLSGKKNSADKDLDENSKNESMLLTLCKNNKAKYASCIAEKIVEQADSGKKMPPKILSLFNEIALSLSLPPGENYKNG
ncbi:MAG: hypothetical protein LBG96_07365, partial [Tannerella sp.]|nr:hypothetical protein [Tannerella sp.]